MTPSDPGLVTCPHCGLEVPNVEEVVATHLRACPLWLPPLLPWWSLHRYGFYLTWVVIVGAMAWLCCKARHP